MIETANLLGTTRPGVSPEERLIVAVIEQAILDVKKPHRDRQTADEAWAFLTMESGGFAQARRDYCEALGLDAVWLRETVQRAYRDPAVIRAEEAERSKRRRRRVESV